MKKQEIIDRIMSKLSDDVDLDAFVFISLKNTATEGMLAKFEYDGLDKKATKVASRLIERHLDKIQFYENACDCDACSAIRFQYELEDSLLSGEKIEEFVKRKELENPDSPYLESLKATMVKIRSREAISKFKSWSDLQEIGAEAEKAGNIDEFLDFLNENKE